MSVFVLAFSAIIMVSTFLVASGRGFARAGIYVYLPVILFLSQMNSIPLPGVPDINAEAAVGYPVLLVLLFRASEFRKVRLNVIDIVMIALWGWTCLSLVATSSFWEAVSAAGVTMFTWLMPYMFGRLVMLDADARRRMFPVVAICAIVIGVLAAMESRINPYFVSRAIESLGLVSIDNTMVMYRYGFARAQVLTPHPIDLGNVGVILGAMILMLTPMLGKKWKQPLPLAGIIGAGMMVGGSVSFTCFQALGAAFVLYFVFSIRGMGKRLVVPTMLLIIAGLVGTTAFLLSRDVPLDAPVDVDGAADTSLWMRTVIVQGSWIVAKTAGVFGYNTHIPGGRIGTGSIDNAYMLFIMRRGWPYLILWVGLAIALAWRGTVSLARAHTDEERKPIAAALAGLMAILIAMYTVWYGFIYAQLFVFLLGMLASMSQLFEQRDAVPVAQPLMADPRFLRQPQPWGRPA